MARRSCSRRLADSANSCARRAHRERRRGPRATAARPSIRSRQREAANSVARAPNSDRTARMAMTMTVAVAATRPGFRPAAAAPPRQSRARPPRPGPRRAADSRRRTPLARRSSWRSRRRGFPSRRRIAGTRPRLRGAMVHVLRTTFGRSRTAQRACRSRQDTNEPHAASPDHARRGVKVLSMQGVSGDLFGIWLTAGRALITLRPQVVALEALCRANNPQDEASSAGALSPRIAWKYCNF